MTTHPLETLGLNDSIKSHAGTAPSEAPTLARVIGQYQGIYRIHTGTDIINAELTGRFRHKSTQKEEFPVVGDWVFVALHAKLAIIHSFIKRNSLISRKSVKGYAEKQPIAANIDTAFIVQSADLGLHENSLDRYLAICQTGHITPQFIFNKTDLITPSELDLITKKLNTRYPQLTVFTTSCKVPSSLDALNDALQPRKTYCFLGPSGVGKSSIINRIDPAIDAKVSAVSGYHFKGKHTTRNRELYITRSGALLMDTPGMREVGLTEAETDTQLNFDIIIQTAAQCRFTDCSHKSEPGCAVQAAVRSRKIEHSLLVSYVKLNDEKEKFRQNKVKKRGKPKRLKPDKSGNDLY